jgi:hypothetical protein
MFGDRHVAPQLAQVECGPLRKYETARPTEASTLHRPGDLVRVPRSLNDARERLVSLDDALRLLAQ